MSTLVPMALGSVLLRIHEARTTNPSLNNPLAVTALGLTTTGAVIGPSMGAWCLGGTCARRSILPLGLRVAGTGEVLWALWWTQRRTDRDEALGVASILAGTFLSLPGFIMLGLGMAWSFRDTPRIRCGSAADAPTLAITPTAPAAYGSGSGLALRLTL